MIVSSEKLSEKKTNNLKICAIATYWYIKSNRNLPFGQLMHRVANKGMVSKQDLKHFEKLAIKRSSYQEHLRYFDKCIELDLIPDFIKFKPPDLEVYKDPQMYYRQVLFYQNTSNFIMTKKTTKIKHLLI